MSSNTTQSRILVAVDGSPESDAAVALAAQEAVMRGAPVTLMHVIAPIVVAWPVEPMVIDVPQWYEDNARHVLAQAEQTLATAQGGSATTEVQTVVGHDAVVPTLTDASKEAQLLVVGSRGQGTFGRLLMGSVSTAMVHHAHCPVAVVHGDGPDRPGIGAPVLLGIDGSPASEGATEWAFDEASRRRVDLIALHAWSDFGVPTLGIDWRACEAEGQEALAERLAGWQERYPDVRVHRRIVCDKPARWLSEESRKAQLVVVGSHGRGGFAGMLLGSVSSAVAQSSSAPVIVVRGR